MNKYKSMLPSLIILIVFVISCDKKPMVIKYYPHEKIINDTVSVAFSLDTLEMNFKEFVHQCYALDEQQKQTIVELVDGDTLKKIKIQVVGNGLLYEKNILHIMNDSIYKDKNYPMSDLTKIMKRHYLNKGQIEGYATSADRAIVLITLKNDQDIKDLNKYLLNTTKAFDEMNTENKDSLRLNILIEDLVPPPPSLN